MYTKRVFLIFASLICFQFLSCTAKSIPIKHDGKYYFSAEDTHNHIKIKDVLSLMGGKLLSPAAWKQFASSLFYTDEKKLDPVALLKPRQIIPPHQSIEPQLIWIGHSTFLIQINGFNILTDPIFGDVKCGPITITKRSMPPGVKLKDLPHIDAIILSHNHYDHTDEDALIALCATYDPAIYVPEGDGTLMKKIGFSRVIESTWWDAHQITKNDKKITFTFLPAHHWSIRFPLSTYRTSLWGSWMIESKQTTIYFAGDSAYGNHFKEIGNEFDNIDVALMPIGPTNEGENTHKHCHVDAPEAVDAFIDLGAQCFVPMHYGAYFLSDNTLTYPIEKLNAYWKVRENELDMKNLLFAQCGKLYKIP